MKLHHIDIGTGNTLIFQHGLTSSSVQIQNLLDGIEELRVICLDCPGHGLSKLDENFVPSFDRYTDLIIELMDNLALSKAVFGGLSMGSGIAINAAIRYPERVSGLILLRPAWLDQPRPNNLEILMTALEFLNDKNGQEGFEKIDTFIELKKSVPLAAKSVLGIFSNTQQCCLSTVIRSMVMDFPFSSMLSLKNINIPTIIIGNANDPLHPLGLAQVIHDHIKQSEFYEVMSKYVNPDIHKQEVQLHITNFIKTLNV